MSARRPTLRLLPDADRDYEDISLYTRRTWGAVHQARYKAAIAEAFWRLRDHPRIGQTRDDLFPGCHEMQVEQHLIFYHLPDPGTVEVVRILHQRQDPGGKVTRPD